MTPFWYSTLNVSLPHFMIALSTCSSRKMPTSERVSPMSSGPKNSYTTTAHYVSNHHLPSRIHPLQRSRLQLTTCF